MTSASGNSNSRTSQIVDSSIPIQTSSPQGETSLRPPSSASLSSSTSNYTKAAQSGTKATATMAAQESSRTDATAMEEKSGANTPQWGDPVNIKRPIETNNPDFPALQRALSLAAPRSSEGSGEGSDDSFSLHKTLKGVHQQQRHLGHKEKKLDVAWKDLYVRGVGASAVYGQTFGRYAFFPYRLIFGRMRNFSICYTRRGILPAN